MTTTKLTPASVLAFERKLSNSDAVMFSGNWDDMEKSDQWPAVKVTEKDVRGTISNRQKNANNTDAAKIDAQVDKANLQTVDVAALPLDHDTLKMVFTLRVLGDLATPTACNKPEYQTALKQVIAGYVEEYQFTELARRYASNLANGRFLWRNRVGAESVNVVLEHIENGSVSNTWQFDGQALSLRNFDYQSDDLTAVANVVQAGLKGDSFAFIKVTAYVRLGAGQEVFPSQELILDDSDKRKSKTLYQNKKTAALHSQKIGNALRTIDDWHNSADEIGPIAVEPFGAVTSRGKAYRQPKGDENDFYTLFDAWVCKGKVPEAEQQHYVMANLIRGGVFGGKDE